MPMNFGALFKAYDAFTTLRDAAKRYNTTPLGSATPETGLSQTAASGLAGQVEARLTGVVVAALKEAFDRDHARLELERAHIAEERRRAEEALRLELRRQATDREVERLRLLAGAALVGWISSIAMFALRAASTSTGARALIAAGWLLLLSALAAAFTAQSKVGAGMAEERSVPASAAGTASLWLLVAGLASTALSLLF
jgi:hypothetical protein